MKWIEHPDFPLLSSCRLILHWKCSSWTPWPLKIRN
jgi:hypothetical protein